MLTHEIDRSEYFKNHIKINLICIVNKSSITKIQLNDKVLIRYLKLHNHLKIRGQPQNI